MCDTLAEILSHRAIRWAIRKSRWNCFHVFFPSPSKNTYGESIGLCVCMCISVCAYICILLCVCVFVCMYLCMCPCIYVCLCVCAWMCVCVYAYLSVHIFTCVYEHAHTCACPCVKVGALIPTSLHYDFSGYLPFLHFSSCSWKLCTLARMSFLCL